MFETHASHAENICPISFAFFLFSSFPTFGYIKIVSIICTVFVLPPDAILKYSVGLGVPLPP